MMSTPVPDAALQPSEGLYPGMGLYPAQGPTFVAQVSA